MTTTELSATTAPAPPHPQNPHHSRRWAILGVLAVAQLMVILDATVVNIALPSAQKALEFSNDNRQWIVTAYALAFGGLLPLGGRLGDLIGRKTTLLVGLIGFALASAVGGAAEGFGMLVTARAAQGLFGALLAPAVLSLLTTTFTDAKERGKAFGIYGAISGAGGAFGLLLGGVLTEYLNWRWCMYVNLIFAVIAGIGAMMLLRNQAPEGGRPKLDVPGTITVSAGLFSVVYGFANAESHGWSALGTWGFLVIGAVLLAVFVAIEQRVAHPLIPLRVVLDRTRGGAYLTVLLMGVGMFAIFLFLTYYLQQNLGLSPVMSGVAFLPMIGALSIAATLATSMLLPRVGPRPLVVAGLVIGAIGTFWFTGLGVDSTYVGSVLGPLIVTGLGLGLAIAPAMTAGTSGVRPNDAGVASAMVNTLQQIGGSVGTAVLSTIAANAATGYLAGKTPTAQLAAEATVHSYTTTFAWVAGLYLAGAVLCGLVLRSGPIQVDPDAAPAAHM